LKWDNGAVIEDVAMSTIHINRRLDSELVPELRPLIGKNVRIVAVEQQEEGQAMPQPVFKREPCPAWIYPPKSPAELAQDQGIPLRPVEEILGGWPAEESEDGFEETLKEWRRQDLEQRKDRDGKLFA